MIDPSLVQRLEGRYGPDLVGAQIEALRRHGDAVDDACLWLEEALKRNFKYRAIERVSACACGSTSSECLSLFAFWNLLGYRECDGCGTLFVSPRLTSDEMQRVFAEEYFDPSHPEIWGDRREPVFADVGRLLREIGAGTVLDVGTGYGHFLRWLNAHGFEGRGVDLSPRAVEWGRRHLGVDVAQGRAADVAGSARFSAITCLDTLYYAADPGEDLSVLKGLLEPGGRLILRLRNAAGAIARTRGEPRRRVGNRHLPAQHLWGFTPRSVVRVLEANGWSVLRVESAAYSRRNWIIDPLQAAWAGLNRWAGWVRTHSFNVVAEPNGLTFRE